MTDTLDIDQYTAQIVPDTKTTVTNQYFDLNQPFSFPRYGNACTSYVTGRDYMKAVADAIRHAESFIMITGWQLDYDVELDNGGRRTSRPTFGTARRCTTERRTCASDLV